MTLATGGALAATRRADVRIDLLDTARALVHGARVRVHQGTAEAFARVSIAATRPSPAAAWTPARTGDAAVALPPGGAALARLRFDRPVVVTRGDRLVLRAESPVVTIGGAVVLDPEPAAGGVRRENALAQFRQLEAGDANAAAAFMNAALGRGIDAGSLVRRAGMDRRRADETLRTLAAEKQALVVGDRAFAGRAVDDLRARLTAELTAFHAAHPDEAGMPRETLRARSAARAAPELVEAVLADVASRGVIRDADRVALASHKPAATGDHRVRAAIEQRLQAAALVPPEPAALSAELGLPLADVTQAIQALVREGRLVRVGGIAFHRDGLASLKADVLAMRAAQAPGAEVILDVAAFKARHGLTRKHAIPLLEWLDRERVTRRIGDVRVVR
jgi:selenocysteine-specific elongation factor